MRRNISMQQAPNVAEPSNSRWIGCGNCCLGLHPVFCMVSTSVEHRVMFCFPLFYTRYFLFRSLVGTKYTENGFVALVY